VFFFSIPPLDRCLPSFPTRRSSDLWVHDHIAEHGGDPKRLLIMGHSAGAQLAALLCIDERYLKAEGLSLAIIKGCVPVDGDTYEDRKSTRLNPVTVKPRMPSSA